MHVNISLQFDITSAFIARANKKKAQQATKGKAPPSSAGGGTVTQNAPEYTVEQNMDPQSHSVSSSSRMNGIAPVTNGHSKTPTANTAPKANISEVCTADCVHCSPQVVSILVVAIEEVDSSDQPMTQH